MFLSNNEKKKKKKKKDKTMVFPSVWPAAFLGRNMGEGSVSGLEPSGVALERVEGCPPCLSWSPFLEGTARPESLEGRYWSWLRPGWRKCPQRIPTKMDDHRTPMMVSQRLPFGLSWLCTSKPVSLLGEKPQWHMAEFSVSGQWAG